jgi:hypothetical protein
MQVMVLCPGCKVKGRETPVQVTMLGPDNLYEDGFCVVCQKPFSGRVFPDVEEPGIPVLKSEPRAATQRVGSADMTGV